MQRPGEDHLPLTNRVQSNLTHLEKTESVWSSWLMSNGLRCLHIPLPKDDPRFQITLLIGTGSRHEPKNLSGISHLLEHMMFRGCAKYPSFSDLSAAFESLGGEWNAATGHEYTEFYFNGTSSRIHEAVELFADFILRPALSDLETERRIVLRELEGELNEHGISTDPDFHIATKVWPGTAMAMPIIGTPDTLNQIDINNLTAWFNKWYTPENAVICAVGGHSDDIRQVIQKNFGSWQPRDKKYAHETASSAFKGPCAFWVENSDNEYQIQISFTCEGTGSQKTASYELLSRVLSDGFSSRLTKRIREELGLVYDIGSDLHQYDGSGLFNITASVLGENIRPFFKEVFTVLAKLSSSELPPDELSRHQNRALVDLDITTSEPSALAWRGSWAQLSKTDAKLSTWAKRYSELTSSDLLATARDLFRPEGLCVTALGPTDHNLKTELDLIVKTSWQQAWSTASR